MERLIKENELLKKQRDLLIKRVANAIEKNAFLQLQLLEKSNEIIEQETEIDLLESQVYSLEIDMENLKEDLEMAYERLGGGYELQ